MNTRLAKVVATITFLVVSLFQLARAQQGQAVGDGDARVVTFEDLVYPSNARNANAQGTVVVRATHDNEGKVTDATAISGSTWFTRAAVGNLKTWTFRPNASKAAVIVYNFTILPGVCGVRAGSLFVLKENVATVVTCPAVPMP